MYELNYQDWRTIARLICPAPYTDFKLHETPKFMKRAALAWGKKYEIHDGPDTVLHRVFRDLRDHWGGAVYRGQPCYVMQPYGINAKWLALCERFAEEMGIKFHLDVSSHWYPGKTVSLIFYPPEE